MKNLTRDQRRALHAYACVEKVLPKDQGEYGPRVQALGSAVLRNGLAAALAFLEREKDKAAARQLLNDLAAAGIAGIPPQVRGEELPREVRKLELGSYMRATRDVLHLMVWFRRAVQATFVEKGQDHVAE
ncbi:CRISPR-associated protein Cmr5 [Stigmatella aurantiaca]|uniref:CRISPR type III-B/RAMP module-associated protein Cmr5 n=1 Tax=Stigmatella aurantiaca TaxID=41 RepID=A0A1H7L9D6_STIAU|nr:type III-B CRISPR module-associated protein Cmr5 [Stigmatella aurantiaca]SEK95561.1 CRISPR-associated protein Cmr5 [Stigmatella aurantiaca]